MGNIEIFKILIALVFWLIVIKGIKELTKNWHIAFISTLVLIIGISIYKIL